MATVTDHYANHLAPVYVWMAGGSEAAFESGEADLIDVRGAPGLAVDLGAGFGMHSVPLAKAGFQVLAIDSSQLLADELRRFAVNLPIEIHCADLLEFGQYLPYDRRPTLVLCMGDTLTHLDSMKSLEQLIRMVATCLSPGGRFVSTFRNYTRLPTAEARFIQVRADDNRILTCFLEEFPTHVLVHDILHERIGAKWTTSVSSYPKLRVAPAAVQAMFESAGMNARLEPGPRGMLRLVADV